MLDSEEYQKEKYIAFVDVLGFSEMVNNFKFNEFYDPEFNLTSKDTFHIVSEYYHKLLIERIYEKDNPIEITAISDCVIASSEKLFPILNFVFYFQNNMLCNDSANARIITRGYLTKGKFIHNQKENLIVGEAYQRTLIGEKNTRYPRVEIDKSLIDEIQAPLDIFITKDTKDSKYFVNYLLREKMCKYPTRTKLEDFINEKILENDKNSSVKEKYLWLRNYYNNIRNYKLSEDEMINYYKIFFQKERDI